MIAWLCLCMHVPSVLCLSGSLAFPYLSMCADVIFISLVEVIIRKESCIYHYQFEMQGLL